MKIGKTKACTGARYDFGSCLHLTLPRVTRHRGYCQRMMKFVAFPCYGGGDSNRVKRASVHALTVDKCPIAASI